MTSAWLGVSDSMIGQLIVSGGLFTLGTAALLLAIRHERLMQRHRQPGVTYRTATLRANGGWRRSDLFNPTGLGHQRRAARYGFAGAALWIAALAAWIALGMR